MDEKVGEREKSSITVSELLNFSAVNGVSYRIHVLSTFTKHSPILFDENGLETCPI